MLDAFNSKRIHEMLGKAIERYEKEFGKIEKPKAIEIMEKKNKKEFEKQDKNKDVPSYFG